LLGSFIDELRVSAAGFGYPFRTPSESDARAWDVAATEITWKYLKNLVIAEAGRLDVWAFLTVVACPDLVLWRYPVTTKDALPAGLEARFLGGRRNLLKRFWQRARALTAVGSDWSLLQRVREDDLVQVFERPSLAAIPGLAGMLLTQIASSSESLSARDILKRLNRELPVTGMYFLPSSELDGLVFANSEASREAISRSKKKIR